MKFKEFLLQESHHQELKLSDDEILLYIKKYCSDSLWMLEHKLPLYRGTQFTIKNDHILISDPIKFGRKSANTQNYYTLIFDNHPEMKDWPKRSRSFICTNNELSAKAYADEPFIMIPFDKSKIGIVGENDMWDVEITLFDEKRGIENHNRSFEKMNMHEFDWSQWIIFDRELKNSDKEEIVFNYSALNRLQDGIGTDAAKKYKNIFLEEVYRAYSPRETGFIFASPKNLVNYINSISSEMWIEGKCLMLHKNTWNRIYLKFLQQ